MTASRSSEKCKSRKARKSNKASKLDEAEQERRRLLRRERNQRYQANLKTRNGQLPTGDEVAPVKNATPSSTSQSPDTLATWHPPLWVSADETREAFLRRPQAPIPNGPTPHVMLTATLSRLNSALYSWGFLAISHLELRDLVRDEAKQASKTPESWSAWVDIKERWMEDGSKILHMMENALCSELIFLLPADMLRQEWEMISAIAFRVQYMIATVEAQIDALA